MSKFIVELYKKKGIWKNESEYKTYKEAKEKCISLVKKITGDDKYYSEPNGKLNEGYFGDTFEDTKWVCRISVN